jgi:hypothetical protein
MSTFAPAAPVTFQIGEPSYTKALLRLNEHQIAMLLTFAVQCLGA